MATTVAVVTKVRPLNPPLWPPQHCPHPPPVLSCCPTHSAIHSSLFFLPSAFPLIHFLCSFFLASLHPSPMSIQPFFHPFLPFVSFHLSILPHSCLVCSSLHPLVPHFFFFQHFLVSLYPFLILSIFLSIHHYFLPSVLRVIIPSVISSVCPLVHPSFHP